MNNHNTPPHTTPEPIEHIEHHDQEPNHEEQHHPHPHIWIASLADYVNGRLHGDWIDAAQSHEQLEAAAQAILASSPEPSAEEWAIHDYDGFGPLRLDEYESLETVSVIARGIAQHGPAFAVWIDHLQHNGDEILEELIDEFTAHYLGHYDSPAAWAEELCDDFGYSILANDSLPAIIANHISIDYDALANDLEIDGEIATLKADGGGVWVFRDQ